MKSCKTALSKQEQIQLLHKDWGTNRRWKGVTRPYTAEKVLQLAASHYPHFKAHFAIESAGKLFSLLEKENYVRAMGAMTGLQAIQQIEAGLKAIYVSGWQVAADANLSGSTYPDLSLYPVSSVPTLVERIIQAEERRDQIDSMNGKMEIDWFAPIIADAEAGFGGPLNCFELVKHLILAGSAAIHLEDQLSSLKKCGHMGGKVLVPCDEFIEKLVSARLSADILGASTLLIARTDAESANYIRADTDPLDQKFLTTKKRAEDGFYEVKGGIEYAIARSIAFAPYADLLWFEAQKPNLEEAALFAEAVHKVYPGKWLAYNCSPSFNWKKHLSDDEILHFQDNLGRLGYKFQFVTLAGFHALNASMFELAHEYAKNGMKGYQILQEREFELEKKLGYSAIKHQSFVGSGFFDEVLTTIKGKKSAFTALSGSTEESQFS